MLVEFRALLPRQGSSACCCILTRRASEGNAPDPSLALFDVALLWTGFITRPGIPWGNCYLHFPRKPIGEQRPLTKSRHLTCVSGNYLSPGPSGRRRGNYSSELSGQSELPFGRRQTLQRAGGLPRRSSPGPAGPLTCRRRKSRYDALPSRRRFCVFWESAVLRMMRFSVRVPPGVSRRSAMNCNSFCSLARRTA